MPNALSDKSSNPSQSKKGQYSPMTLFWLGLIVVSVVLDQITKYWAESSLKFAEPVPILPFLNWKLVYNKGAAFSFLSNAGGWQRWFFVGLSVVVVLVLLVWVLRLGKKMKVLAVGLSLVISGAIGNNLIDRVLHGHVIDFIHVYYQSWSFPVFNIADCAITFGAILMFYHILFLEGKSNDSAESKVN